MLLQTNSYFVPKDKQAEHARLMRRFKQTLKRLGCDDFEVHEQLGEHWSAEGATDRFIQIMRFRDRMHHQIVQTAERSDQTAQELIREFCEMVDFQAQVEQGAFVVEFYGSLIPAPTARASGEAAQEMTEPVEADLSTSASGNGEADDDDEEDETSPSAPPDRVVLEEPEADERTN
jgi:hypothetical protein